MDEAILVVKGHEYMACTVRPIVLSDQTTAINYVVGIILTEAQRICEESISKVIFLLKSQILYNQKEFHLFAY
jgi:hypothetical protein